jgi:hypothetical protein
MSEKAIRRHAEALVRETFSSHRKQPMDEEAVKAVADKIFRSLPAKARARARAADLDAA